MATGDLLRMVPILTARDVAASVRFYERLGLRVTADHGDYVILATDADTGHAVEVHLSRWEEHDPRTNAGSVYLRVADAGALYERLRSDLESDGVLFLAPASGLSPQLTADLRTREDAGEELIRLHEVEDKPWGQRQFSVIDPAGWLVQVGSPILAS